MEKLAWPYIARSDYATQTDFVGNKQCVTLVKELANARPSSLRREGDKVIDLLKRGSIPEGTVIATFFKGRYPNRRHGNHAAIFVRAVSGGIEIFDQWTHHKPAKRTIRFQHSANTAVVDRPESYSVVE